MNWNELTDDITLNETITNLKSNGIDAIVVENKKEALEKVKELIPKGSEVMNGSSTTLHEIGFVDYLKEGNHGWNNLHVNILETQDPDLRRKSVTAEYFLSSVNAISKTGALVSVDNSGSRVGAHLFAAKHLILVAGTNKIVDSIEDAMRRVREHAFPLENERAKKAYGFPSNTSKWAIIEKEINNGRIKLILVKEKLGF